MKNVNIFEDSEIGLHPVTLTGIIDSDYPNHVQVKFKGGNITQFARMLYPAGFYAAINDKWLKENASNLIGYVAFEKGNPEKALLVSVSFKDGHSAVDGWPYATKMGSNNFSLVFNDEDNKAYLEHKGKLHLGSKDASSPAALGDKVVSSLESIVDQLSAICTNIALLTVNAAGAPSTVPINAPAFTQIKSALVGIKNNLSSLKSDKLFLD